MKVYSKVMILLLGAVCLTACNEDEGSALPFVPVQVSFQGDITLGEAEDFGEMVILFDRTATVAGAITVSVESEHSDRFVTVPASDNGEIELPVAAGQNNAIIKILPEDDGIAGGDIRIDFRLTAVSEGYIIGARRETVAMIEDDEFIQPVLVEFLALTDSLLENESMDLIIGFSAAVPSDAVLWISHDLDEAVVVPAAETAEDMLLIPVSAGAIQVAVTLSATDDNVLLGHRDFSLEIVAVEGPVQVGQRNATALYVLDDELVGKPASWESQSSQWRVKHTYAYDETGRVKAVYWEQNTPEPSTGTRFYHYAGNGLIARVEHYNSSEDIYIQENGRIVRMEQMVGGVMKSYRLYDYDDAGNVAGVALYHRQTNGEYLQTQILVALYYTDGNLYKTLMYIPGAGEEEEPVLVSEKSYENYLNTLNPFPFIELIPGINAQKNFAGTHRVEEEGTVHDYLFEYSFDTAGRVVSRAVTGQAEYTIYKYY